MPAAKDQLQIEWDRWERQSDDASPRPITLEQRLKAFADGTPAPFVRGSDTSEAAAKSIEDARSESLLKVLADIREQGENGSTCDETVYRIGMLHQSASARYRDLAKLRAIEKNGQKRKTKADRNAAVWVAVKS